MSFEGIRIAVEAHMSEWDGVPVAYDGVLNSPTLQAAIDAKEPWVRLTLAHGDSFIACLGDSPETRRTGLIQCQVFTPDNTGSAEAHRIADSLAAHLQYKYLWEPYTGTDPTLIADFELQEYSLADWREGLTVVETLSSSAQRVGPSAGWFQVNTRTPFRSG